MRLLVASSSFLVSYLAFNNVSLSLGISLIAAFLYEDLPSNVDNFYATYVLVKVMKFNVMIMDFKVRFFGKDELVLRRAGLDKIKPKMVPGCQLEIKKMGTYQLYVFTPEKIKADGAVIYYHGGGFTVMHVDTYQRFISNMAVELGCVVFSPEYRLAPEAPWPKGDEDVHHATQHVFDNTEFYNINRKKIVLTGDSAGGFFTLVTWYRMRDYFKKENIQPALLSFIYPAFGYRFDSPSYIRNMNSAILPLRDVLFYYLCHPDFEHSETNLNTLTNNLHFDFDELSDEFKYRTNPMNWLPKSELENYQIPNEDNFRKVFSPQEDVMRKKIMTVIEQVEFTPLNISDEALLEAPDCQFIVCEHDVLKNDGQIMHARLKKLDKCSSLYEFKGAYHGQQMFARPFLGLRNYPRSTQIFQTYLEDMRPYL